ncbi:alpha/beta hydrolase [Streptomyces javensis]|uniref:alpha/beta fold hydrolase n=1 Tax=Streptomyces javensis TaxID=114698 RepID=UPI0033FCB57B
MTAPKEFRTKYDQECGPAAPPRQESAHADRDGHRRLFAVDERLPRIAAPATIICGQDDDPSMPSFEPMVRALSAKGHIVSGAGVPFPEQRPEEFARLVREAAASAGVREAAASADPAGG